MTPIDTKTVAAPDEGPDVARPGAPPFWMETASALCARLGVGLDGLSTAEAAARRRRFGSNVDAKPRRNHALRAVVRRLLEPLSLILLAAGALSAVTGDGLGGAIIVAILGVSIGLDTLQEGRALQAADALNRSVAASAEARRDGVLVQLPVADLVPGDLIRVRAGDIVPADALVIESAAFSASEAALTGEPYPVEKRPGAASGPSVSEAGNAIFRGSVALAGEATAVVAGTGPSTVFGAGAKALAEPPEISPFQRDLRSFGLLTARLTIALVLVVLVAHVLFGRPVLQSLLFAAALAVGLTPELLPMITTVTLSRGAVRMASRKVIVKRLAAIHDLGAMTVLCTDKTGTLTSAEISLARSLDPLGGEDVRAARLAAVAAGLGGDRGALDRALTLATPDAPLGWTLVAARPFDFQRRFGVVTAQGPEGRVSIVKGAPEAVLALCSHRRDGSKVVALPHEGRRTALELVTRLASEGLRTVAVATGPIKDGDGAAVGDLIFEGLCAFADPPKASAAEAIARLGAAGIRLTILSGDEPVVVRRLAGLVGFKVDAVLSGTDIAELSDEALAVQVRTTNAYGRLAPDQKARIVRALRANGEAVGYLGDGINDAPALKTADIGLSVSGATGVAQAASDMILLESDLDVVADGVEEGRRTFANILKYVRMGASSNFGNMLSMSAASLFLPFLPMLPVQILLNNLLYDVSELGIPFDTVSSATTSRPQVWDMHALLRFAAVMGPLSSLFDMMTFAALIVLFHASPGQFQTAWFLESIATQILVIFIIRTRLVPWKDRPSPWLAASSLGALTAALAIPFTPLARDLGFEFLGAPVLMGLGGLVVAYLVSAQVLKPFAIRPARIVARA